MSNLQSVSNIWRATYVVYNYINVIDLQMCIQVLWWHLRSPVLLQWRTQDL